MQRWFSYLKKMKTNEKLFKTWLIKRNVVEKLCKKKIMISEIVEV